MKPFKSAIHAVRQHHRWARSLAQAQGATWGAEAGLPAGSGRREDVLAVYMSVELCLDALTQAERLAVDQTLADDSPPRGSRERARLARDYHRAMTKLGREMRRRGVVG